MSDAELVDGVDKEVLTDGTRDLSPYDCLGEAEFSCVDLINSSSLEDQSFCRLEYDPHTTLGYLHNQVSSFI